MDTPQAPFFRNQTHALYDESMNYELYITYFLSNKNEKVTYNDYNLLQLNVVFHCPEFNHLCQNKSQA